MKVEAYQIKGWNTDVAGVVMSENDDWILINEIPVDYQVDGFTLINKAFVKKRYTKKFEKRIAKVLSLKKYKAPKVKGFKFGKIADMLLWIENKYGFFQFQDDLEESLEIGVIDIIKKNNLSLLFLKQNGKFDWKYVYEYKLDKIRKITFDSNYLQSLKLLAEDV